MTAPLHVGVVYVEVVPLVPVIPKLKVMLDEDKPGAAAYTFVAVDAQGSVSPRSVARKREPVLTA